MMGSQVTCCILGSTGIAVDVADADALGSEHGDIAVAEEKHIARVAENGGNIAGDEVFVLAQADDHGRADARGHDFVRILGRENRAARRRR